MPPRMMIEWIVSLALAGAMAAFDDAPSATPPPKPPAQSDPPPKFDPPPAPAPGAPLPSNGGTPAAPPAPAPSATPKPPPAAPAPSITPTPPAAPAPSTAPATTPAPADASPRAPRRVWIFIDRYKEAGGTVESEDDVTLVIRDTSGARASFAKGRVMSIVTLVEPPEGGQDGIIHYRDGRELRALIHKDDFDAVEYEIAGIRNRVARDDVAMVSLEPEFEERYRRFRESIKPNEVDKRLTFARWLVNEKRYTLAAEELRALTKEVDLPEARELLRQVEAQLALDAASTPRPPGEGDADPRKSGSRPASHRPPRQAGPVDLSDMLPTRILAPDDVNIVRVYEVDVNKPPRLDISPDVIRDLITKYGSDHRIPASPEERNRMFSWEPSRLLKLMFDLKARDLYPRVRVTSEPWSLNLFRTRVHDSWLIPNCATSQCHGGIDAGRFFLHRRNSKEERVRYTNLLILLRTPLDHPLVDFEDPESSLIIQYALPRDEARRPHPDVKGWKAVFAGSARGLKGETMQWIRGMYRPRPEYPVDYEPPRLDAIDRGTGDSGSSGAER